MKPDIRISKEPLRPAEIEKRYKAKDGEFFALDSFMSVSGGMTARLQKMLQLPWKRGGQRQDWVSSGLANWAVTEITNETEEQKAERESKKKAKDKADYDATQVFDRELFFKASKKLLKSLTPKEKERLELEVADLEETYSRHLKAEQTSLADSVLNEIMLRLKEATCIVKGYDRYIEYGKLEKYFDKIRGGKIALTEYEMFMLPVPKDVAEKRQEAKPYFDAFIVMHCFDPAKLDKDKTMSAQQKSAMAGKGRDPILFGTHDGSDRMWFIADWIDEFCDLTFGEVVRTLAGLEAEETYGKAKSALR